MKIGGVTVSQNEEILVLPRHDGDIVIKAAAVLSMDEFDAVCPQPEPPVKITKNGKEKNFDAKNFVKALEVWSERRYQYICLKSLEPSNIEWDKVDIQSPGTWAGWTTELLDAGISQTEMNRIQNCILDANALNEAKLKAAREDFLRGQGSKA